MGFVSLLAISCFTACSSNQGTTAASDTAAQKNNSSEKRVVTIWYDGTEEESVKKLEPEFETLHPEIDLQFEIVPYKDLSTKEMVACQAKLCETGITSVL